eukprot:m.231918 g.231918  ORF g.231918 m.231918 type:complete len:719 (-) comp33612_c1_seq3:345-2501(-)
MSATLRLATRAVLRTQRRFSRPLASIASCNTVVNSKRRQNATHNSSFLQCRLMSTTPIDDDKNKNPSDSKESENRGEADTMHVDGDHDLDDSDATVAPVETTTGPTEDFEFQAETRKLLDIVAGSLYTDKEVFVREIVSNASDALEKLRYRQVTGESILDADRPLEIHITTDADAGTFTIQDTGVGMTKDELIDNLGCIARSGTKTFIENQNEGASKQNMIGQFGVGFYSTFMVGTEVSVFSQSSHVDEQCYRWISDGSGKYSISEAENCTRGTKIQVKLNDECKQFSTEAVVKKILEKHSNFVGFPVFLNGNRVNNVDAIWTKPPSKVSAEEHDQFYKFIAGAWDDPQFTLHFATDAPLQMKALLYVPTSHTEQFGTGRMDPGVSLYCRKVLVLDKAPKLLPDWLRFVRGVVDSEDIPLNLSRELLQDSALINKMSSFLSSRLVRFLSEKAKKDTENYLKFYKDFSNFLREGACTDRPNQKDIMKLMRYESSTQDAGSHISLEEYFDRIPEDQDSIYYLQAPKRQLADASPYMEALTKAGIEVLFCFDPLDEVVLSNVQQFNGKKFVSVESNLVKVDMSDEDKQQALSDDDTEALCTWIGESLGTSKVSGVVASKRLVSHPAIISDEPGVGNTMRMMMKAMGETSMGYESQKLEINSSHPLIKTLQDLRESNPEVAAMIVEQVFDNALIHAGRISEMDRLVPMVDRITKILEIASKK